MTTYLMRILPGVAACFLLAAAPAAAKSDDAEFNQAKKALEQAMAGDDSDAIVAAIETVAADASPRAADLLLIAATSDKVPTPRVYEGFIAGLRTLAQAEDVRTHLVNTLDRKTEPKQWAQRSFLCDALSTVEGAAVTTAIAERLKDNTAYVISAAAKALAVRRDKAGVVALIDALKDLEKKKDVPWLDVRQALTAICGYDFESHKEWTAFWAAEGEKFDPAKSRGNTSETTTEIRDEAKFFTEVIVSKRVVFVIDVSGSMKEKDIPVEGDGGGGTNERPGTGARVLATRIDVVKKALIAAIKGLKSDVRFNIVAFSTGSRSWRPAEKGLQSAGDAAKQDAIRWVAALEADGATETDTALEEAFKSLEMNTIVLLSDGQPVRAVGGPGGGGGGGRGGPGGPGGGRGGGMGVPIEPQTILDKVKVWNRLRGVKIHTFCFKVFDDMPAGGGRMRGGMGFDPQKCLEFLQDLAEQNGGKLTKV